MLEYLIWNYYATQTRKQLYRTENPKKLYLNAIVKVFDNMCMKNYYYFAKQRLPFSKVYNVFIERLAISLVYGMANCNET